MFLHIWQRGGWVGVDLFFVLSGFLVAGLLFKEHIKHGEVRVTRFLVRRGFKIYPAFWVLIACTLFVREIRGHHWSLQGLLGELLFVQNYAGGIWGHTWSLAVEEHFYIGLAILVAAIMYARRGSGFAVIPPLFLLVAAGCLGLRLLAHRLSPDHPYEILFQTHTRIDSLFFGVCLAYFHHYRDLSGAISRVPTVVLLGAGLSLLLPAFIFTLETHAWIPIFGVILFYLGSGFLVLAAIRLPKTDNRYLALLGVCGAASYSIYLWHVPVNSWGINVMRSQTGSQSFTIYMVAYIVGSCAVGYAMNRIVEWPTLRLRDRYFPSRSLAIAADRQAPSAGHALPASGLAFANTGDDQQAAR